MLSTNAENSLYLSLDIGTIILDTENRENCVSVHDNPSLASQTLLMFWLECRTCRCCCHNLFLFAYLTFPEKSSACAEERKKKEK